MIHTYLATIHEFHPRSRYVTTTCRGHFCRSGAAYAVVIPNNANLAGAVLFSQYAEYDVSSPAVIPYVLSNGGALPVY